jgi:hypothetical protein
VRRQLPLLLQINCPSHFRLQEDGLPFSGMMVVAKQSPVLREGHPMALSHSACGPSNPDSRAAGNGGAEDADISSLLGMLASVTDPRSPQGIQHALQFVLAVCVVAMLAGAKNYREIAGQAADMPQPLLKKLGAKWNWFRLRCKHPSESTIRNVLTRIDAAELDLITGAWLFAQARKYGKTEWEIAVDGKVMRGAWTGIRQSPWGVFSLAGGQVAGVAGGGSGRCGAFLP